MTDIDGDSFDYEIRVLTLYERPKDFPELFVARWLTVKDGTVTPDPEVLATALTLEKLREVVPPGLSLFPRHPSDDPCIVESWL